MAVMTPSTFDPLRRFVNVRLQQGVPLVDADWNELEDIRKFELRAYLKWFVGDGIPDGNDGFRVEGTGVANDFSVRSGVAGPADVLGNVGRCLINGLDIILDADLTFAAQPLHVSQAGSAALAAALGVPQIAALTTPVADGIVTVFADVTERIVTAAEEPSLVHPALGTESCARVRREFAIRVRDGAGAPVSGDADFLPGHSYYALATIRRRTGDDLIHAGDVGDLRERRLLLPPATLIEDLFGIPAHDYRRGIGRPPVSVRDAINALMRGELPGSPEAIIAPAPASDDDISRGTFFDAAGGLVTIWSSDRAGAPDQVFGSRLSLSAIPVGFADPPAQITAGVVHQVPHAAMLASGETIVVYQTDAGDEAIHLKRADFGSLGLATPELAAADSAGVRERNPFVVVTGGTAVVFWHANPPDQWQFRRYDVATNSFPNAAAALSAVVTNQRILHAARDASGSVWAAFATPTDIQALEVPPAGLPLNEVTHSTASTDTNPFVLIDPDNNVWVFWHTAAPNAGIFYRRFLRAANAWEAGPVLVPGTNAGPFDQRPAAVAQADGSIWLFWQSMRSGNQDIWFVFRNPLTQAWGEPRQITGAAEADLSPNVLRAADDALWLFWQRNSPNGALVYRRFATSI
jgi:hypothetical protein